jgi:CDP-6-deoxy-D-xylo-4-hexulose-3-dehydrase
MGEGGAVVPRNAKWKRVAESMRDWGRDCWCEPGQDNTCGKRYEWQLGQLPCGYDHKYTYSNIGYNLKATDMQAALGLSQLRKLDRFIAARCSNWQKLYEGVRNSPVLSEHIEPVTATEGTTPSWFGFPLYCSQAIDREKLVVFLEQRRIGTRLVFGGDLTRQPAYQNVEFRVVGELKSTDRVMRKGLWLAVHPALNDAKIAYMLDQLEQAVRAQL